MNFYEEEFARLSRAVGLKDYPVEFQIVDPSEDDRYVIRTGETSGRITGSNERSLLQGVYRVFYHLGVRYLGPGRRYEWTPPYEPKALVQDFTLEPKLRHRGVCIEGADSLENILDMIDWLPKIGMNSFFLQFREPVTFLRRWYDHVGNSRLAKEPFDIEEIDLKIREAMQKRGLLHHRVGHGWTGAVLSTRADGWDTESDSLSEEALEMCAKISGKRGLFGGIPLNTNLCMSSEKVQQRFTEEVVGYARSHPEVDRLHVWLADDCNNHCECENCLAKTPTDLYIDILNRIDEALTREGLPTKIVFLLYLELLWAPEGSRLKNEERFILMFAPISRSFESGYREVREIPETPPFTRNRIQLPVRVEENLAFLKDWQKVFTGDSFDYDYHLGRAHFGDPGYMRISRLLNEDIYQLPDLGLSGMIACQELRAGFPHFLPNYVMGYTLTEPAFSFGDQEDEYFMAAYGPYAQEVMRYLEKLSALASPDWFNKKGPRVRPDLVPRYEEALELVLSERPKIEAMTSDHPVTARFLEILRYHSLYEEWILRACLAKMKGEEAAVSEAFARLKDLIETHEADFQECLDVYRLQEVMRNYTGIG